MGWHDRVKEAVTAVKESVMAIDAKIDDAKKNPEVLDEVVRNLLDVQHASNEALAEIYDAVGPFVTQVPPKRDK